LVREEEKEERKPRRKTKHKSKLTQRKRKERKGKENEKEAALNKKGNRTLFPPFSFPFLLSRPPPFLQHVSPKMLSVQRPQRKGLEIGRAHV